MEDWGCSPSDRGLELLAYFNTMKRYALQMHQKLDVLNSGNEYLLDRIEYQMSEMKRMEAVNHELRNSLENCERALSNAEAELSLERVREKALQEQLNLKEAELELRMRVPERELTKLSAKPHQLHMSQCSSVVDQEDQSQDSLSTLMRDSRPRDSDIDVVHENFVPMQPVQRYSASTDDMFEVEVVAETPTPVLFRQRASYRSGRPMMGARVLQAKATARRSSSVPATGEQFEAPPNGRHHLDTFSFSHNNINEEDTEESSLGEVVVEVGTSVESLDSSLDSVYRTPMKKGRNDECVMSRSHCLAQRKCYNRELCDVCGSTISFGLPIDKCEGCGQLCHSKCAASLPVPCLPRDTRFLKRATSGTPVPLASWCHPKLTPQIPPLIIQILKTIDKHHLGTKELYNSRVPDRECRQFLHTFFASRRVVDMEGCSAPLLTSALKMFMASRIQDGLIPANYLASFLRSGFSQSHLKGAFNTLPTPNKDTLSILLLHWKRVVQHQTENGVSSRILMLMMSSAIFPYSGNFEQKEKMNVLLALIQIPNEFFANFLYCNELVPIPRAGSIRNVLKRKIRGKTDRKEQVVVSEVRDGLVTTAL